MKLTVDTTSFVDAVSWVAKSFDKKDASAYVALTFADSGETSLSYASATAYTKKSFVVLDHEDAQGALLTLDGQFLQRAANAVAGAEGPLELEKSKDGTVLHMRSKKGAFRVPLVNVTPAEEPETLTVGEVDERSFFDMLQRLSKLCDNMNAESIAVLGSVDLRLDVENEKIVGMATDRYVLGEITVDFSPGAHAKDYVALRPNILMPSDVARLISPPKAGSSSVTLVYEERGQKFGYRFPDGRVDLYSLTNTDPLPYEKLKAMALANTDHTVTVELNQLKNAVGTISSLVPDEANVTLEFKDGNLAVTDDYKGNRIDVELQEQQVDEDYDVRFRRAVISKVFNPVGTSTMNMKFSNEKSTFLLEAVLEDGTVDPNVFVFFIPTN